MGLTKLNFNEIENTSETSDIINFDKTTSLKQETILPTKTPPKSQFDGAIWVDSSTNNLKVKVNSVIYELSPQVDYNNITISSPYTFPLNGNVGVVNNLTIEGSGTTVNFRSSSVGVAQWSILEIKGNLTVASGCTLNLIRTPLIVRGNISGSGTITSPNGTNGGAGGAGGTGGVGGPGGPGYYVNYSGIESKYWTPGNSGTGGGSAPTLGSPSWANGVGGATVPMPVEYGISSGSGGPGGRGTSGGGGGGSAAMWGTSGLGPISQGGSGGNSGNGYSGGIGGYAALGFIFNQWGVGGGGGGAGGPGSDGFTGAFLDGLTPPISNGGPGAYGNNGETGGSAGTLSTPYIGIGISSSNTNAPSAGQTNGATFGGQGGPAAYGIAGQPFTPDHNIYPGNPGSPGGTGGNGGAGGGTGGAHMSIYCAGTLSSLTNISLGKGGLTGGSTSLPRAQTGSLWLFTPTGSETLPLINLSGGTGTPTGQSGVAYRYAISNSTEVNNFYSGILYEASGPTVAKTKIAITYP